MPRISDEACNVSLFGLKAGKSLSVFRNSITLLGSGELIGLRKRQNHFSIHALAKSTTSLHSCPLVEGIFCIVFDTIPSCSARSMDHRKRRASVGRWKGRNCKELGWERHSESKQWNVASHSI